jgi:hypothetical protein
MMKPHETVLTQPLTDSGSDDDPKSEEFSPTDASVAMGYHLSLEISPEDVVHFLKTTLQYQQISHQICCQRITRQIAEQRDLIIPTEVVQQQADRFRHANEMEKASDTLAWLQQQQVTPNEWEEGIRDQLLTQKLAETLFEADVNRVFAENRINYDRVLLYQLVVPYEQIAQELFYQIEESEISFYEAAHLYDIDPLRRQRCGFEGMFYRWKLHPSFVAPIFSVPAKRVIPPLHTDAGYHLLWVEEFLPAELTPEVHSEILQQLFQQWLNNELTYLKHH